MMQKARLRFLGTGTSQGVPIIGCRCERCLSTDSRDKRFRSAAYVEYCGLQILVDAGPDFRSQMIAAGIGHLDAILLTHNHKDHTGGLDDVRALNYIDRRAAEIYCEPRVLETLREEYSYAFAQAKYPGSPEWKIHLIDDSPFIVYPDRDDRELTWVHDVGYRYQLPDGSLVPTGNPITDAERADDPMLEGLCGKQFHGERGNGAEIIPVRGLHGTMPVLGYRFGNIAYITDMSVLPESEYRKLEGLDHLTLNTVGYKKHHSHFSLDEALEIAGRIGAEHTWLTHLSHTFPCHEAFEEELARLCAERGIRSDVRPAYDGLVIE